MTAQRSRAGIGSTAPRSRREASGEAGQQDVVGRRTAGRLGVQAPAGRSQRPAAGDDGESRSRAQVAEIQRSRLLAGAVRSIEELGYAGTTVAHITRRARVSRRTFYELFANREECLAAILEDLLSRVEAEIAALGLDGLPWRERVRAGLGAILAFLDSEPELARVCVVQALRGGPTVLEQRERILARLTALVDAGRREHPRGAQLTPLMAEGLVGAAFAIVHSRLLKRTPEPLICLQRELMSLIVLPYLGASAARREQLRTLAEPSACATSGVARVAPAGSDPLDGVPMRLTYRTSRVLQVVAEHPQASNRTIAQHADIADQGQVSKLLARLRRLELLTNAGEGHLRGEPNSWTLTPRGQQVAQRIRMHIASPRQAA